MSSSFVHLHVHSDYSLLDGMGKIKDYVALAQSYGMEALSLTDHGVMYGAIELYMTAKKQGVKPIVGCEMYVAPRSMRDKAGKVDADYAHLLVLARDYEGYQNLLKLVSCAHLEGYYYKPRIDHELLAKHSRGLVVTSSCIGGEVAKLLLQDRDGEAREIADKYRSIVGSDNYFIEVQDHPFEEQQIANKKLVALARDMNIPLVATADVHYPRAEDHEIQDILLCIQTGRMVSDANRMRMSSKTNYLRSPEEMEKAFAELPESLSNTLQIAEMCDLEIPMGQWILPHYDVPDGFTPATYLRHLCEEGLKRRYATVTEEVRRRLEYELDIIEKKGYPTYMLIVQDFVNWARQQEIAATSRGSAAGSLVSYLTNITSADPLEYKLPFERFLNPYRPSPPDIDMDFEDSRREEVIQYVTRKYGDDRVAQIITFGTMEARAAVRDVGRVLGISYSDCDSVAKMIQPGSTLAQSIEASSALREWRDRDPQIRRLLEVAARLEGVTRHASTHAAGVIISRDPIVNYAPMQREASGNKPLVQYDMRVSEAVGLLKMDFLGLANLSILGRAVKTIKETTGREIDLDTLPLDDAKTYALLSSGETTGVFQLESPGMRRYIKELRPTDIRDVAAMISLYRPGPMEMIPTYIERKHDPSKITYLVPQLKSILQDSYGVLVYQDDILLLSIEVAGYTWEEADKLRKAVGKKIKAELDAQREKFVKGCQSHGGLTSEKALELWDWLLPFARYGFGKCASGRTYVTLPGGSRMQISRAYALGIREVMSMWPDGQIRPHKVRRIVCTGKKALVQVRTKSGRRIKVTPEHRLLTTEGYKPVSVMSVGMELIIAPRRTAEAQRMARRRTMTALKKTDEQRRRASVRLGAMQRQQDPGELVAHLKEWAENNPDAVRANALKMHERLKWLHVNDPDWKQRTIANSIASTRACYDTGPGYGRCSIATNGMWCASQPERDMCEWLIEQGIDFEMHKVLDNGRICDFYFRGIYWEMDGMDRAPEYFVDKYGDLPYVVVTPEDFCSVVAGHLGLAHAVNGDPIVSIRQCGEEVAYDIEMEPDGPLNYIANKLVSHNSHAAAYSLVAYQTAYLKANYPSEYMSAFLTVGIGNSEKIASGIAECKRMGVPVLPPDINRSEEGFSLERGAGGPAPIRFGLGAIKNVGSAPIAAIVAARNELPERRFKSLVHLCQTVDSRLVNRRVLESLIKAGAADEFGARAQLLAVLDEAMSAGQRAQKASGAGQMSLFGGATTEEEYVPSVIMPAVSEATREERLAWEKEMLGLYITEHPLTAALAAAADKSVSLLSDVSKEMVGQPVRVIGMLTGTKVLTTRKKQSMLVSKLEDLTGSIDLVVFPECYEKHRELLQDDAILEVSGKVDERNDNLQIICDAARPYSLEEKDDTRGEAAAEAPQTEEMSPAETWQRDSGKLYELRITLPTGQDADADIARMQRLERALRAFPGSDKVRLQLAVGARSIVIEPHSLEVLYSSALELELEQLLGGRHWRRLEVTNGAGPHQAA